MFRGTAESHSNSMRRASTTTPPQWWRPAFVLAMVAAIVACSESSAGVPSHPGPSPSPVEDCRGSTETAPGGPSPTAGVTYSSLTVDNKLRDYRLFRPPALDVTKPVPLVIVLHGSPIDAAGFESVIHFDDLAAQAGYLVASPNGCGGFWSYTRGASKVADTDFIVQVIHRLEAKFPIDKARVFVVAASAGSPVAYRLACDQAGEIVAVASISGTMRLKDDCQPARPVSILAMHGTADTNVPYQGGGPRNASPIEDVVQRWRNIDGCTGDPTVKQSGITTTSVWNQCKGGAVIRFDKIEGGTHGWFGDPVSGEPSANAVIWSFFRGLPPRT